MTNICDWAILPTETIELPVEISARALGIEFRRSYASNAVPECK